jgi:transitional endoplasmic reticulum ATPase
MFKKEMSRVAAEQIKAASRPPTEQEKRTAAIMANLDELGGKIVGDDNIVFEGTQIKLPRDMEGKLDEVVAFIEQYAENQNAHFNMKRAFNYRPHDVAAAFGRTMKKLFGVSGVGKAQFSMFGIIPPEYISVNSGPNGETIQVPWGKVEFSLLEAEFYIGATKSAEFGTVGEITVDAPKKNRNKIDGFFKVLAEELQLRSIYRGHAITAHPKEPQFLDLNAINPARVIYTEDVETQLRVNLWAPLQYSETLAARNIPFKRAVLLFGPNGTGKTLAGGLAAMLSTQNGITYILVRAQDDPMAALETAAMYEPAVVMVEDIDTVASANQDRNQIKLVLDRLDNVAAKGRKIMVIFTTNEVADLDRNVLRPGRIDAAIEVGALDRPGYERLVKALIEPEFLSDDINYDTVCEAMYYYDEVAKERKGFLPAFATEAIQRSMRYRIMENHGEPGVITTDNLVDACKGMASHIVLMDAAERADDKKTTMEAAFSEAIGAALSDTTGTFAEIEEGAGMHSVFENVQVEYSTDGHS